MGREGEGWERLRREGTGRDMARRDGNGKKGLDMERKERKSRGASFLFTPIPEGGLLVYCIRIDSVDGGWGGEEEHKCATTELNWA